MVTTHWFGSSLLATASWWTDIEGWFMTEPGKIVLRVLLGLAILVVGWLLAKMVALGVFKALCRTTWDDKIAEKLGLNLLISEKARQKHALERAIAAVIYYMLLALVLVAALQYTGLTQVAGPIERLVDSVLQAFPSIAKAVLILGVAYVAALILRKVTSRGAASLRLDERFAELAESDDEHRPFSDNVGRVVFWLILLLGLAGALDALKITALSEPLTAAITQVVATLPAVAKAALLLVGGYVLGRIARAVLANLLASVGLDRLTTKLKLEALFARMKASAVVGLVAFWFIMLQVFIAALNALGLETLSAPLTEMVGQFWNLLPSLLVAGLIVGVGVVLGRLARGVVENVLKSLGFDKVLAKIGLGALANRSEKLDEPSEFMGLLVQIAIILLATAQALDTVGLVTWSLYLNTFLAYLLKNVSVAIVIVAVGFAIGNYVRDLVIGSGEDESRRWLGVLSRYTVLVFAFTMAVHHLDIAPDFVLIAFALLFGALCLALALAFGLGSREVASDIVSKQYKKAQENMAQVKKK